MFNIGDGVFELIFDLKMFKESDSVLFDGLIVISEGFWVNKFIFVIGYFKFKGIVVVKLKIR